jgi:hypothetical protein
MVEGIYRCWLGWVWENLGLVGHQLPRLEANLVVGLPIKTHKGRYTNPAPDGPNQHYDHLRTHGLGNW